MKLGLPYNSFLFARLDNKKWKNLGFTVANRLSTQLYRKVHDDVVGELGRRLSTNLTPPDLHTPVWRGSSQ